MRGAGERGQVLVSHYPLRGLYRQGVKPAPSGVSQVSRPSPLKSQGVSGGQDNAQGASAPLKGSGGQGVAIPSPLYA